MTAPLRSRLGIGSRFFRVSGQGMDLLNASEGRAQHTDAACFAGAGATGRAFSCTLWNLPDCV